MFGDEGFQKSLDQVVQIAIEFHDLQDRLGDLERLINRLSERFSIVHFHANNFGGVFEIQGKQMPHTIELTFVRNSFLKKKEPDLTPMPVDGLDYPNNLKLPDINLSQLFY